MASETLEEKKPGDGGGAACVTLEREEIKENQEAELPEEELEGIKESEKKDEDGDAEMTEKEGLEDQKEIVKDKDEEEGSKNGNKSEEEEKEINDEEEEEESKKGKRSRKRNAKKKDEDSDKKKEPVTPIERPTRERKVVERYSEPFPGRSSASKSLSIGKGSGLKLRDIPNVAFKLSKRKPDENLQILHTILFGKKAKVHSLKKNIGQFSGYVWTETELEKQKGKVKEKLEKCVKEKLVDFCDVLNIPINKAILRKEELCAKLLEFLESPHATTEVLLADKEQKAKRKRKATPSKLVSGETPTETPAKKQKGTPETLEKRKGTSEVEEDEDEDDVDEEKKPTDKDDSDEDDDSDRKVEIEPEQSEEDEPKKPMLSEKNSSKKKVKRDSGTKSKPAPTKGSIPAKSTKKSSNLNSNNDASDAEGASGSHSKSKGAASKKQVVEKKEKKRKKSQSSVKETSTSKKESSKSSSKVSTNDQGKRKTTKKAKVEPSREEMHAVVVNILKEVDFNTATLSDILRQLGTYFGIDLIPRKAEVKDIITDVINNMTDEEDEGEDENAETENDADENDNDDGNDDEDGDV